MSRLIPCVVVAVLGVGPVLAQETTSGPATVVAMGEGRAHAAADLAIVTLATETHADTAADTQGRGNALMKGVQAAIDGLKLAGVQVTTTGLMLSPNWIYGNNQRTQRGFVGRHSITVRFAEPGRAGELVAAAIMAGANDVANITFDRRDRRTLEQEALKAAVQDARARADALAAGAGHSVDRILRIEEGSAAALRADVVTGMSAAAAYRAGIGSVPIAQGDVEILAHVVLTAAVK